jgi:hypothetical protein
MPDVTKIILRPIVSKVSVSKQHSVVRVSPFFTGTFVPISESHISCIFGTSVSAWKPIKIVNGCAELCCNASDNFGLCRGISISATAKDDAGIIAWGGLYTDPIFQEFNSYHPIFFNEHGDLTQIPPTQGFIQQIGDIVGQGQLRIDLSPPILLA